MYGNYFYHNTIRKYNLIIGSIFDNISINRDDGKTIKVPISFAPKEEYITLIKQQNSLTNNSIKMILPRMSFEMTGMSYAPDRMQAHMQRLKYSDTGNTKSQYQPVAYDFTYDLNIMAKHFDDIFQIVEQILPFFTPTINFPIKDLPELDVSITHDIAIELTDTSLEYDYEGSPEDDTRIITQTLSMTLRGYIFNINKLDTTGIIKKVINRYYDINDYGDDEADRFLQKRVTQEVTPPTAGVDDPYTITKTDEEF